MACSSSNITKQDFSGQEMNSFYRLHQPVNITVASNHVSTQNGILIQNRSHAFIETLLQKHKPNIKQQKIKKNMISIIWNPTSKIVQNYSSTQPHQFKEHRQKPNNSTIRENTKSMESKKGLVQGERTCNPSREAIPPVTRLLPRIHLGRGRMPPGLLFGPLPFLEPSHGSH